MILKAPRAFGDSRTTFRGSFARPVDPASQGTGSTSSPSSSPASSSSPQTSCLFFSRVSCLHIIVSIHRNRDPCHHHFVPIIVIVATLFALFDQHCHDHHCCDRSSPLASSPSLPSRAAGRSPRFVFVCTFVYRFVYLCIHLWIHLWIHPKCE